MEFHEVATLFPMMSGEEFDALVEDIRANGLREDIWTHEGKIIDGRNRYNACQQTRVTPRFRPWDGKGSLVQFVVSLNLKRRHLSSSQKAMVANDMLPLLEAEAKKRQGARTDLHPDLVQIIAPSSGKARDQAAEIMGTNRQYVSDAKVIATKAPDLADKVREGKITLPEAKKLAKLPEEDRSVVIRAVTNGNKVDDGIRQVKQQRQQEMIAALPEPETKSELYALNSIQPCDIHDLKLPPNSIDMVFTDPPYHDEHVDLYEKLAEVSFACGKPGSYVMAYAGKMFLPQVIAAMSKCLEYVTLLAVFQPFSKAKIMKHNLFENWRPIVVFKVPGHTETKEWTQDVVRGTRDKEFHEWQQDSEAPLQYIAAYTKPGDTVLDPFVGGGTTPWACKKLGRYYLAYDTELDAIKVATERVRNG